MVTLRLSFIAVALVLSSPASAFLSNAKQFCTETDVAQKILRQTEPMTPYKHGDNYAFLVFQKQRDLSLMFDRIGDFVSTKKIDPKHQYDNEVEGFAITPTDMVKFFNHAKQKNIALTVQEKKLEAALRENGSIALNNNRYTLQKPVYMGAAHKGCGNGTAEHELNHMYFDSTPKYKAAIKKLYSSLKKSERQTVTTLLTKLGYDSKTLAVEDNLLGEFSAFFRDPKTLRTSYAKEIAGINPETLDKLSESLLALEKENSLFSKCPDGSTPSPEGDDDTSNAEKF